MWLLNNNYASAIIQKISKFGKTYQELTLDTVKKFLKDSSRL